jgi:hypothetical protein
MLLFPSRRAVVLVALAFAGSAPIWRAFAAETSAKEFVDNIYKAYLSKSGKGGNGVSIATDAAVRRYFSAPVAALIIADARQAKKRDDVPALDGDPFVGHQDWEITTYVVDISEDGATAKGMVTLTNEGKPEKLQLSLVKTSNGWRIDDVVWTEGSLRGIYKKP